MEDHEKELLIQEKMQLLMQQFNKKLNDEIRPLLLEDDEQRILKISKLEFRKDASDFHEGFESLRKLRKCKKYDVDKDTGQLICLKWE